MSEIKTALVMTLWGKRLPKDCEEAADVILAALDAAGYAVVKKDSPDVVGALGAIKTDLQQPAQSYAKHGPTWTGKDGHEYEDTSMHLDFAAEIEAKIDAILTQLKGETR